jgi:outer membrane cobalamin receptor
MKIRCFICLFALAALASPLLPQTKEKTLDELLSLDMNDLLNLKIVSALKGLETINRVPATVRVITADDIRINGYFTLEEALADLPGFQFRNILGFNSYAFIRGVPSQNNKILLLVDGIQTNELNSGGFYGGGQYNLANVDRIEVVYGPASALYGTNAVSGIINIITLDPKAAQGGRASVLAGSYRTYQADVRYAAYDKASDFGFSLAGMLKRTDKADLKGAAGDNNWTEDLETFENDAALEARTRYKDFSAGFVFQDKNASYATTQVGIPTTGLIPVSDHGVNWHIRFLNLWATYARDWAKAWSIRSTAYYRNATVQDDTLPIIELPTADSAGRQYRYFRPNHLVGNETQVGWTPNARWRLSFGVVFELESLAETISITQSASAAATPPVPPDPAMQGNSLVSLFAQSQTSLSKTTDLFLGLRHDESSYYGAVTTPRLGLVYNKGKLNAKILYMQAFRAPKPWDYTNGIGNPGLRPETIYSVEAAGGWSFSPNLRFDLSVYHNRLTNLLIRETEGSDFRWVNGGALTTDGCETGLEYRRGRLKAFLNYTYTRSVNALDEQAPEIAPHGANAGILYAFSARLRISLRGQYLGARKNSKIIPAAGNDRIDAAFILHAALTLSLPYGFDLQLVVNNLLDAVYYHPSILPPSRYRQPQRSLRLSMGYAF